ncbi:histidine kinase N-terminal 7TM domain-containing protein [Zongyangia hominis]|uniref:histidine kinase n=1 Tax=Zongyangia hominis TaxID=2763677 RepID=A0A926EBG4_9FIRM|nr:histidine kinase N-terminal 7TM domain-containing protein [Zongyangia hominis]MBC8569284.1 PAS domain S-box protein [Zongyangia hominis]
MVSDLSAAIFAVCLIAIGLFCVWSVKTGRMQLIHKLYLMISLSFAIWALAMLGIKFTDLGNTPVLFLFDALTYVGGAFAPVFTLCIALVFAKGYERMPKWSWVLFIMPAITTLIVWTNPWHHLMYKVFSVIKSEIVFGPYMYVAGLCSYVYLTVSLVMMITFAVKNSSRLYRMQCLLFSLGGLCPLAVSMIATFSPVDMPISATPLSFIPTIIFNGIAIYQLHLFDIKPIALQHILDWIPDCYLILSEKGLVISFNKPFEKYFASVYGIRENKYLSDCAREEDVSGKTAIYNMITAVDACRESGSGISYEQAVTVKKDDGPVRKNYYVTDVSPLDIKEKRSGYVVIFKDITPLKKSMQQLQDSQTRMMEQERFAFLGQMMGGLAHNLKTPIMSISGCISAADTLVQECYDSLDDPQVEPDDYREIYGEIRGWFDKVRESSAYMSDIITAIKGQANSVSAFDDADFTLEELIKRTNLLMRHELMSSGCRLIYEYDPDKMITLHGDINNLIQVMNNLLSNAIYAQKQAGGGIITIGIGQKDDQLRIFVKDTGPGVDEKVRNRLFKEMITSKGTMGSGLGLYISNAVVRAKFGGSMWVEENPGGGSIFGLSLPMDSIRITDKDTPKGGDRQ